MVVMNKNIDIVYFCKEADVNEELTYSIRSVEKNFPYRKLWIYGGCPKNIKVDNYVHVFQKGTTKWDKVRDMLKRVALNDDITEDFYLFNDDFFVIKPVEEMPVYYRCSLPDHILHIEVKHNDHIVPYTRQLRRVYKMLLALNKGFKSYELHMPFLYNRKKLLELVQTYPDLRATRSLYGNYYDIGGVKMGDVKVYGNKEPIIDYNAEEINTSFLSTDDKAWRKDRMNVASFIRKSFPDKSKYEK